uniref:protein-tyrosine-phosphatase n=1 Tax=Crassostrea virginica TaxID=6565 RepID=A0A8B8ARP8_CRAVI|nr:receptor-type tyrosine-protein phosphatase epsilon-like isoform X2 [Crassostrea virginica]
MVRAFVFYFIFGDYLCQYGARAYENLALGKSAWQLNPINDDYKHSANNVVDGRKSDLSELGGECTASSSSRTTAMWWVDLGTLQSIHHIIIQYATGNQVWDEENYQSKYFLGYSVYVSPTKNKEDGVLCFRDTNYTRSTIPNPVNISCPYPGRYVIYYNNRTHKPFPDGYSEYAYNDLCEVEVYGCHELKHYGTNCSIPCPRNCLYGVCDIMKGDCPGCVAGHKGRKCNEKCDEHQYGLMCNQTCGSCYGGRQCDHVNGSCTDGCEAGLSGENCDEECLPGFYGINCQNKCSVNCGVLERCDGKTGECDNGCQKGWLQPNCVTKCHSGTYGQNCTQSCGKCVAKQPCHYVTGACMNGCERGYQGMQCKTECYWGTYGYNCNETCERICSTGNDTCDAFTGFCPAVQGSVEDIENKSALIAGLLSSVLVIVAVIVFVVLIKRKRMRMQMQQNNEKEINGQETREKASKRRTGISNNSGFSNMPGNLASFADERTLIPKPECNKMPGSKEMPRNLLNAKKYDVTDDENDEEGVENPYGNVYINEEATSDIPISELSNIIEEKRKKEDEGFKKEYTMLPYGEQFLCDVGKRQENLPKNRYKTIFPYDHSRVVLRGTSDDYINANYINGTDKENEYIASQGPKQSTLTDFWAMIWQKNVTQIVMLTNLKEGVKVKCTQYWPENMKARVHGDFVIKNTEEKEYAFYVIRKLTVSLKEQKKSCVVTQYHYTTWPDHGTPDPLSLVVFHSHVLRAGTNQKKAPVVVHCSAGIGRTGTYIALDALHKGGKTTGKINVAEYVKVMRSNRMNMVQTYEQYMVIFLALNEKFKADVKPQSLSDFTENVESLIGDVPANQTVIRKQFEKLLQIRPEYSGDAYKNAIPHASNPNDTVLPLDKFCLYLTSSVGKRGSYINAISVSSFLKNNAFIVSQYPTPEDAVDFLRLLTDHESDTVICLNPLQEIKSSKSWFPSREASTSVVPFTVQNENESESDTDVKTTNIKIVNEENQSHPVVVIEPKGPLRSDKDAKDTSCLRNLVSYALNISTESPLTILSKDGASLCGVFCAVFNCIQQINMDESVDVFTTVRQLQTRRPEFCSTQDEFLLVYKTVRDYVETTSENVYFNQ